MEWMDGIFDRVGELESLPGRRVGRIWAPGDPRPALRRRPPPQRCQPRPRGRVHPAHCVNQHITPPNFSATDQSTWFRLDVQIPGAPWDAREGDCTTEVIGKEGTRVTLERRVRAQLVHVHNQPDVLLFL